jgi:Type II secretion system (T2SS), protein K
MKSPSNYRTGNSGDARRGSVIIFVLGVILLTAFLLTRLMDRAAVELAAESKATHKAGMRQEAYSALEASLAVLAAYARVDNGLHSSGQGWNRPLDHVGYIPASGLKVEVTVEDDTGKLSLPSADETVLRGYLDAIGVPATSLDELVDALLVWTKDGHVPQGVAYDAESFGGRELPYRAPQRSLRSFEELRAIPIARAVFFEETGEWNEIGDKFKTGVSLFSFAISNINSARMEGMLALGLDPTQIDSILRLREERLYAKAYYRGLDELSGVFGKDIPPPAGLGTDAVCLHVIVSVRLGARDYRLDAWVTPGGQTAPPQIPARKGEDEPSDPAAQIPAKRGSPRIKVDSPFQILELRENYGT